MRWLDSLFGRPHGRRGRTPSTARLAVEALESRHLLDATPNQAYVAKVLRDLLRRDPDPAALARFASALDRGASRTTVALAIQATPEFRQVQIRQLVQQFLRREPTPPEFVGFSQFLGEGGTPEQL